MDTIVKMNPTITVLMPVYNSELYIKEAVESILNQTYADFEFLILDDASTDQTVSVIKTYNDSRIKLIEKPSNTGYTNSLNYGLTLAKGKYIARMDGDDISLSERFAKQVAFLDANQDVVVCGTNFSIIGSEQIVCLPKENEAIKLRLLNGNCMAHPSVMIRKQDLDKLDIVYDVTKEPAEDYDLWVRLLAKGNLHNIQEVLLKYRVHNTQVSSKRETEQKKIALETRLNLFKYLNCTIDDEETLVLKKAIANEVFTYNELKLFLVLKNKLIHGNSKCFFEDLPFQNYLNSINTDLLKNYFVKRRKYSPIIFFQYLQLNKNWRLKIKDEFKLALKSLTFYEKKNV